MSLWLETYLVPINLQQDGPLEKTYGKNQAQGILNPNYDSHNARQHPPFYSHPLTGLKKRKRPQREANVKDLLQGKHFCF